MTDTINLTVENNVATLTIEREARRNALNNDAIETFLAALEKVRRSSVVALIITGEGKKAFCAGSDLKALASYSAEDAEHHTFLFQQLTETIDELPCATIAAIEGACLGGGLEIALACDFKVASRSSWFGFPEINVGALPTGGGTIRAPRAIGLARTREMMIFGEPVDSETALRYGLISETVPEGTARLSAAKRAQALAGRTNREAIKLLKAMLVTGAALSPRAGAMMAYLGDVALVRSESFKQGVAKSSLGTKA